MRRFGEIDALKAMGAITIVLIHCLRPPWTPGVSDLERWLAQATAFAVPGFLFASGFLAAAGDPRQRGYLRRRFRRLLLPYLVASLLAQLYWAAHGAPRNPREILSAILLGASFGPYYYVFLVATLLPFTPLLSRLSARGLALLVASCFAVQVAFPNLPSWEASFFFFYRFPPAWWPFFLVGWLAQVHYPRIRACVDDRRLLLALLASASAVGLALATRAEAGLHPASLGILQSYAVILTILLVAATPPSRWRVPRFLSTASYTIYLFHLFFVYPVQGLIQATAVPAPLAVLVPWLAGVVGPIVVVMGARRVLGARSRDWIGA